MFGKEPLRFVEHVSAVKRKVLEHITEMRDALGLLRVEEVMAGSSLLAETCRKKGTVFVFGNGGSASTASHLSVDLGRLTGEQNGHQVRVVSLCDNVAWLTAVSNDVCYADVFAEPLRRFLEPEDLVVGISASGDSENVVRAFEVARQRQVPRLALIGFDGGRMAGMTTHRIWVDSYDYGIVESVHSFVGHCFVRALADMLRPSGSRMRAGERKATSLPAARRAVQADVG